MDVVSKSGVSRPTGSGAGASVCGSIVGGRFSTSATSQSAQRLKPGLYSERHLGQRGISSGNDIRRPMFDAYFRPALIQNTRR
jgi:hypothetical protein